MRASLLVLTFTLLGVAARAENGVAKIKGTAPQSTIDGLVSFEDSNTGLKIKAELSGLPPGQHGFHIHEYGSCDEEGKAAGGHYNPKGAHHGMVLKDGIKKAHGGDFGNITADAQGKALLEIVVSDLALSTGKYNVAGRAVVIHEKVDDFGQPTGNAGSRIGCGTIILVAK